MEEPHANITPRAPDEEEEVGFRVVANLINSKPVLVTDYVHSHPQDHIFFAYPFTGALLFQNDDSSCRDNCAAERTFLSYLRLGTYMAVVSIAIVVSFHFKTQPSAFELRIAKPVGILFWFLGLISLAAGFGNYIKTVKGYARRQAVVQSGWKTHSLMLTVALCLVGVCILFLSTDFQRRS